MVMKKANAFSQLTRRQQQITRLVAQGLTNPEIGERLDISQFTVATHLQRVFTTLGMHSRVKLARIAPRIGRFPGRG